MASPPSLHIPIRTVSLPSREHPILHKFDAVLNHLKTWQILSESETAPFGAESIQIGLVGLAELYNYVDEIILTPHSQQAIFRYRSGKLVEDALDGSLTLLDTCSIAKEIIVMIKQHVLTLQSAFRRRNSSIGSNIHTYIHSRKNVQKEISICLGALKKLETKVGCFTFSDADQPVMEVARVIREASNITISIFRSLLLFLSMPVMKTKVGWSLVSKLMPSRMSSSRKGQMVINEVKSLDLSLFYLSEHLGANNSKDEMKKIQKMLETLNLSLDSLEAELECMSRCLVQNRVSLLNILTQ
ncbi:hypothetical protein JCGZ_22358 [Jatropha curcas]|uniref:Uncharacterized protein n=1 Tax=Jatropha curcas TaxID=180498 RepID=A0A067L5L4_JATCU|nr:uncharacterized protein LOC105628606 [Jatropha curcas]KDP43731.1 hypothetical protein JCGZ_22358 [Jatropha curcas]